MSKELYEVIALTARYLFILLGVVIVLRAFLWLRKDRAEKHRRLKALPDAGMVGELVVLRGSHDLPEGMSVPVPREGVLGFVRGCDMVVPCPGVRKHHLDVRFEDGTGLLVIPRSGCAASVDGVEINCRSRFPDHPMLHGSVLEVGDAVLRLRLFSGVHTERSAAFPKDAPPAHPAQMPDIYLAGPYMMPAAAPGRNTVPYPDPVPPFSSVPDSPYASSGPVPDTVPAPVSPAAPEQNRVRRSDRWKEDWSE